MKTEEQILKRRDFLRTLLEGTEEDLEILGTKSKQKVNIKIGVLNWVLDDIDTVDDKKFRTGNLMNDRKAQILKLLEMENKAMSSFEISNKLNIPKFTNKRYLHELFLAGYLEMNKIKSQGCPKVYKIKGTKK